MDVTLHMLNEDKWMEIKLPDEKGQIRHYFGQAGRWHLVTDGMKYLLNNSDIQSLDRIYYVQEAKLIFSQIQELDKKAEPVKKGK